jgi:bacteriocin-like protein
MGDTVFTLYGGCGIPCQQNQDDRIPAVQRAAQTPTGARRSPGIPKGGGSVKEKKLTLSKETLRTLDEKELSQIVGGDQSGSNTPPQGGPNSCPNTKPHGCS